MHQLTKLLKVCNRFSNVINQLELVTIFIYKNKIIKTGYQNNFVKKQFVRNNN